MQTQLERKKVKIEDKKSQLGEPLQLQQKKLLLPRLH